MGLVLCFLLMSLVFIHSFVLSRLWCEKIAIRLLLYIQDNVTLIVFLNKN
ncbi:hypothetical protein RS165_09155 [Escherichia coli]|nr:hypothetical protein [Escherichia coli]MDM9107133.1 hypothetical protein [Escherichia coli]WNU63252.1 hypothetical protein RS165_09155 [Escherichia coli]